MRPGLIVCCWTYCIWTYYLFMGSWAQSVLMFKGCYKFCVREFDLLLLMIICG
ncbi:hypothetical protein HanXRQr2_Chr11g0513011 [Helianthus annuus]|uniref:Uncharacterized protein n=1 Tax=Helianthus annuus TaxID=4232 RepID=A0A9K3HT58_HELAN|nr:hypothetical protein HanXRQr2_Chr11g0513011 [Helianthus annuus]